MSPRSGGCARLGPPVPHKPQPIRAIGCHSQTRCQIWVEGGLPTKCGSVSGFDTTHHGKGPRPVNSTPPTTIDRARPAAWVGVRRLGMRNSAGQTTPVPLKATGNRGSLLEGSGQVTTTTRDEGRALMTRRAGEGVGTRRRSALVRGDGQGKNKQAAGQKPDQTQHAQNRHHAGSGQQASCQLLERSLPIPYTAWRALNVRFQDTPCAVLGFRTPSPTPR